MNHRIQVPDILTKDNSAQKLFMILWLKEGDHSFYR